MTSGNASGAPAASIGATGAGIDAETCSAAHAVPASALHLVRPNPANAVPVAMDGVKDTRMEILVGRQHGAPNFAMRHYVVAPGGHTPHHAHNYEHEVIVIDEGFGLADEYMVGAANSVSPYQRLKRALKD